MLFFTHCAPPAGKAATPNSDNTSNGSDSDVGSDTTIHGTKSAATQSDTLMPGEEVPSQALTTGALVTAQVNMVGFEHTDPDSSVTAQYTYNPQS